MKASQLRRFVTAHFGLSKANLWRGAGHRNFSFLGLALVLLTFHFSPAVVSAQDMTSAKRIVTPLPWRSQSGAIEKRWRHCSLDWTATVPYA